MENLFLTMTRRSLGFLATPKLSKIKPPKIRIKKLENGLTVAMLALIDPDLYYDTKHSGGSITDPKESAQKLIKKLKISEHPDVISFANTHEAGKSNFYVEFKWGRCGD